MKSKKEDGSGMMTAIAVLAALSLTTKFVYDQSQKNTASLRHARTIENTNAMNVANMNSLARIKALLSTRKLPGDIYEPSLVAKNYYDGQWTLIQNSLAPAFQTTLQNGGMAVQMKSVQIEDQSVDQVADVLKGQKSLAQLTFDDTTVQMIETHFDADHRLATAMDVRVISQQQVNGQPKTITNMARVPLAAPVPFNPILELSPPGMEAWTRDFSNLKPGAYDARVLASGVAFNASIDINGKPLVWVGGFDVDTGKVLGKAVNYMARDQEVGRAELSLGEGSGSSVNCVFQPLDQNFKVTVRLYGPAKEDVTNANTVVYAMQTHGEVEGALTDEEYVKACPKQCPFVGPTGKGKWNTADMNPRFAAGVYSDVTYGKYMFENRFSWKVPDKKVCMDFTGVAAEYESKTGSALTQFAQVGQSGLLPNLDIVTYEPGTCKRDFLFKRGSCGCFSDDTKIVLGDGVNEKRITDLTENDQVWNPMTKRAMSIARMTRGPEKVPMLEISAGGKTVKVTGKHPFPTPDGVRTAFTLQSGDRIRVGSSPDWVRIESIKALPSEAGKPPVVWNLELQAGANEADHFIVADGVVTGDLYLQMLLEKSVAGN